MPSVDHRARTTFAVALSCPIVVGFCVAFVDGGASSLAHADFNGHDAVFRALTHMVDPLLPLAALGLAGSAFAGLLGWRPGRVGHLFIACCLAVLVSAALKDQLKYAFGRPWPETWVDDNPSWIKNGAYGFFPFHGRAGWSSFPSGHMTEVTAPDAVLWAPLPRWRLVLVLPVLLVAVGLFGADYHFVGDMVAGVYLGAACGAGILAVMRTPAAAPYA